jgi:dethiobiotin synthetase
MSFKIFVTGTNTSVGKTYISVGLLKLFKRLGYSAIGIKPIASDGFYNNGQLYNQDGLDLNAASSFRIDYEYTNPFIFEPPISPDIAARKIGFSLSIKEMSLKLEKSFHFPCDIYLIEGVGGWSVPLNARETMADLVSYYQFPVIIVVGVKLGCINHAILTYQAIKQRGLSVLGWVANHIEEETLEAAEIITTLRQWLDIPCLGEILFEKRPENFLIVDKLLHDRLRWVTIHGNLSNSQSYIAGDDDRIFR